MERKGNLSDYVGWTVCVGTLASYAAGDVDIAAFAVENMVAPEVETKWSGVFAKATYKLGTGYYLYLSNNLELTAKPTS